MGNPYRRILGRHFTCVATDHTKGGWWWTITRIRDQRVMTEGRGSKQHAYELWRMFEEGEEEAQDRPSNWPGNRKQA